MHDIDYELSDFGCDLDIQESNSRNSSSVTKYDDFDKTLLKKRVDQNLVQQARSCSGYANYKRANGKCVRGYSTVISDALSRSKN